MESEIFIRTELLLGKGTVETLSRAKVAIFGIGGVGGYVAEALARSGIGSFVLVDRDTVSISNINRQIIATTTTVGRSKTEVMKERILEINPEANVETRDCFFLPENAETFDFASYDYVIDAVDTVTAKIALVLCAKEVNVPVISAMGAGNKLDPTKFEVADLSKTSICPLARVMRRELKKRGVENLKVVYSKEIPIEPKEILSDESKRVIPGSVAFVPSVAGLIMAGEVVKDLLEMYGALGERGRRNS